MYIAANGSRTYLEYKDNGLIDSIDQKKIYTHTVRPADLLRAVFFGVEFTYGSYGSNESNGS